MNKVIIDYAPTKKCKHPEWTYGEICVKCGECGRFNTQFTCINCGFIIKNSPIQELRNWGIIEFVDGWFNICPKCKSLFKKEDQTLRPAWKCKMMECYRKDFKRRL
jgi:ssDNA-binding Zn-finger/Zn-ribbon topoisomerase 1